MFESFEDSVCNYYDFLTYELIQFPTPSPTPVTRKSTLYPIVKCVIAGNYGRELN